MKNLPRQISSIVPVPNRCAAVFTVKTESLLHSRVQESELFAERSLVDRSHSGFSGVRRQRAALGSPVLR